MAAGRGPRVVAVVFAHELRHCVDLDYVARGAVTLNRLKIEVEGFVVEAILGRACWPSGLPNGTGRERDRTTIATAALMRPYAPE